MSNLDSPKYLGAPVSGGRINNPTQTRPAQVATYLNGQTALRWTVGEGVELFPNLAGCWFTQINDAGTICGSTGSAPGNNLMLPIRLKTGTSTPEVLRGAGYYSDAMGINNSADVLIHCPTPGGVLYRDDWDPTKYGKYAAISRLLIGSSGDLAAWSSASSVVSWTMNDRGDITNAGQIAGSWTSADGSYARGYFLTPVTP